MHAGWKVRYSNTSVYIMLHALGGPKPQLCSACKQKPTLKSPVGFCIPLHRSCFQILIWPNFFHGVYHDTLCPPLTNPVYQLDQKKSSMQNRRGCFILSRHFCAKGPSGEKVLNPRNCIGMIIWSPRQSGCSLLSPMLFYNPIPGVLLRGLCTDN